ncbi:hypothetical protein B0H67DRAFT_262644 [Lasiosphaeris hirsuta]|uniref:Uncharacterized protein n=1 Tax=Lasiosphaeris hirsuta TaxID=260670 RepID=A0AA40A794_9PEZI|nr:hypothetical protein B0H67DRAFT_262644 [Lasiosphaeris hirsuta]
MVQLLATLAVGAAFTLAAQTSQSDIGTITRTTQLPQVACSTTGPYKVSTVYRSIDHCITCSCGRPATRPPCTTQPPVTNTIASVLPYVSDCTLFTTCETSCNCPQSFCTPAATTSLTA